MFWLGATPDVAQFFLLSLSSGIMPDSAQWTIAGPEMEPEIEPGLTMYKASTLISVVHLWLWYWYWLVYGGSLSI